MLRPQRLFRDPPLATVKSSAWTVSTQYLRSQTLARLSVTKGLEQAIDDFDLMKSVDYREYGAPFHSSQRPRSLHPHPVTSHRHLSSIRITRQAPQMSMWKGDRRHIDRGIGIIISVVVSQHAAS